MKTLRRITEVIEKKLDVSEVVISVDEDLKSVGINSLNFIKLIIAIENEFDIEFEDEYLDYNQYSSLKQLAEYVDKLIS